MPGKISDLNGQTGVQIALTDLTEMLDVSDTSMAPTGTNKKVPQSEYISFLNANGVGAVAGLVGHADNWNSFKTLGTYHTEEPDDIWSQNCPQAAEFTRGTLVVARGADSTEPDPDVQFMTQVWYASTDVIYTRRWSNGVYGLGEQWGTWKQVSMPPNGFDGGWLGWASGQALWASLYLDNLQDVVITDATDGQVIGYNAGTGTWGNVAGGVRGAIDESTDWDTVTEPGSYEAPVPNDAAAQHAPPRINDLGVLVVSAGDGELVAQSLITYNVQWSRYRFTSEYWSDWVQSVPYTTWDGAYLRYSNTQGVEWGYIQVPPYDPEYLQVSATFPWDSLYFSDAEEPRIRVYATATPSDPGASNSPPGITTGVLTSIRDVNNNLLQMWRGNLAAGGFGGFWRLGTVGTPATWGAWQEEGGGGSGDPVVLPEGTDYNTVLTPGIYSIPAPVDAVAENAPSLWSGGMLEVVHDAANGFTLQTFTDVDSSSHAERVVKDDDGEGLSFQSWMYHAIPKPNNWAGMPYGQSWQLGWSTTGGNYPQWDIPKMPPSFVITQSVGVASYTLAKDHQGALLLFTRATAQTITIPKYNGSGVGGISWGAYTVIWLAAVGAGTVTITPDSANGVTLNGGSVGVPMVGSGIHVLTRLGSGAENAWQLVTPSAIAPADGSITNAKLSPMPELTVKGNSITGATSGPFDVTYTSLRNAIASGAGSLFGFEFNTTTSAGPASTQLRLNNATPASATIVYVSYTSKDGVELKTRLLAGTAGDRLYVQERANAANYQVYELLSAPTDGTTYATCSVIHRGGAGSLWANQAVIVAGFTPAPFTVGPTAPTSPSINDLWVDTT